MATLEKSQSEANLTTNKFMHKHGVWVCENRNGIKNYVWKIDQHWSNLPILPMTAFQPVYIAGHPRPFKQLLFCTICAGKY